MYLFRQYSFQSNRMSSNSTFQNDDAKLIELSPDQDSSHKPRFPDANPNDQRKSLPIRQGTYNSLLATSLSKLAKISSPLSSSTSAMSETKLSSESKTVCANSFGLVLAFFSGVLMTVYSSMIKILGRFWEGCVNFCFRKYLYT